MVLAFKLVGVDGFAAETRQEVLDAFNRVTGRGGENSTPVDELPRVLILTEAAAALIEEEELQWQKKVDFLLLLKYLVLTDMFLEKNLLQMQFGKQLVYRYKRKSI